MRLLRDLHPILKKRLNKVGLLKTAGPSDTTLKEFIADFFKNVQIKPTTKTTYEQTSDRLMKYFGENASLRGIDAMQADKFRQWLKAESRAARKAKPVDAAPNPLADSTIARRIKHCRQIFRLAVKWKFIDSNPFEGVKAGSQSNKARRVFIPPETIAKVLDACPDEQWRLMIELARYGGLRCPSEILALRWGDVDFGNGRIRVTASKTEHLEGRETRIIPLFPELRARLQDAYDVAEEGSEHVITRYRLGTQNLRTQFHRLIKKAGLTPWPKPWQNLRASRATELRDEYPEFVINEWLGHCAEVAREHYVVVKDDHFDRAVMGSAQKAAQNSAHQGATQGHTQPQTPVAVGAKHSDLPQKPRFQQSAAGGGMTPTGFEPVSRP